MYPSGTSAYVPMLQIDNVFLREVCRNFSALSLLSTRIVALAKPGEVETQRNRGQLFQTPCMDLVESPIQIDMDSR